jgi:NADH-ubiquinone oxidoreductase chain 4
LASLLFLPILGVFIISSNISYESSHNTRAALSIENYEKKKLFYKITAFSVSTLNLIISLVIYILFNFSSNQFQFVQEHININMFDIYLGVDGISIYFVLLTTLIMPIALLSN